MAGESFQSNRSIIVRIERRKNTTFWKKHITKTNVSVAQWLELSRPAIREEQGNPGSTPDRMHVDKITCHCYQTPREEGWRAFLSYKFK